MKKSHIGERKGYRLGWRQGYDLGFQAAIRATTGQPATIGYVIPGCAISGGISVICQHTNRLRERGYEVCMITLDDKRSIDWFPNEVPIVPVYEAPAYLDIVVATHWSTVEAARKQSSGRKYYFVQSDESRFYTAGSEMSELARSTYQATDFRFMTMANWLVQWLSEQFGQHAVYIPNGLDDRMIYRCDPLLPKGEKVRVLLEGEIANPLKGMREAFQVVRNLDCEVWCVSANGRPEAEWRCDRFFEAVPYEQMRLIYSSCDVLLKMSQVESFLYPPLEMMACGGTAVVAEVTGIDEYIRDGYNAIVVPPDIAVAEQALQRLIEDAPLRQQLAYGGMQTASMWNWQHGIDLLEMEFRRRAE